MKPRRVIAGVFKAALGEARYAELRRRSLGWRSSRTAFGDIYEHGGWKCAESASGTGSTLTGTVALRRALPGLMRQLNVHSILDAGCGDVNWISTVDLAGVAYIGMDVVPALIERNQAAYGDETHRFICADISCDPLPIAAAVLCRHCLIHLSNQRVLMALRNFKRSGCRYLLTTTFPRLQVNRDI
ncbi:MAG: class I SAM-dependent methyltransferase, partial [Candidatus Binataceae bacterium]